MGGLGSSLTESIVYEAGKDTVVDIADAGIDAIIASGALDGVPIFGILNGLYKSAKTVQTELFIRQVYRFLSEANQVDLEKKRDFIERLERNGKKEEFGETILLILNRLDDTLKPLLAGRIMAAHFRGDIDYDKAMRLVAIISRCYTGDLDYLEKIKPERQYGLQPIAESLFTVGLLSQAGLEAATLDSTLLEGMVYKINEFGELMLRFALNR